MNCQVTYSIRPTTYVYGIMVIMLHGAPTENSIKVQNTQSDGRDACIELLCESYSIRERRALDDPSGFVGSTNRLADRPDAHLNVCLTRAQRDSDVGGRSPSEGGPGRDSDVGFLQ